MCSTPGSSSPVPNPSSIHSVVFSGKTLLSLPVCTNGYWRIKCQGGGGVTLELFAMIPCVLMLLYPGLISSGGMRNFDLMPTSLPYFFIYFY